MAVMPDQPEHRRLQGESQAPEEEGLDRRTRSLVLVLAVLSSVFFAGAIAIALGTGGSPEPSRVETSGTAPKPLPREWAGLDPLRPVVREPRERASTEDRGGVGGVRGGGGRPSGGRGSDTAPGGGRSSARRPAAGAGPAAGEEPRVLALLPVVDVEGASGLPTLADLPPLEVPELPDLPDVGGGVIQLPRIEIPRIVVPNPAPRIVIPPIRVPRLPGGGGLPGDLPGDDAAVPGLPESPDLTPDTGVSLPPLLPTTGLASTSSLVPKLLPLASGRAADVTLASIEAVRAEGDSADSEPRAEGSSGATALSSDVAVRPVFDETVLDEGVDSPEGGKAADRAGADRPDVAAGRVAGSSRATGSLVERHVQCRVERPRRRCSLDRSADPPAERPGAKRHADRRPGRAERGARRRAAGQRD